MSVGQTFHDPPSFFTGIDSVCEVACPVVDTVTLTVAWLASVCVTAPTL